MKKTKRASAPESPRPGDRAAAPARTHPEWPIRAAVVLFAASGCAALIYEIVWFQLLELVVGSSAISLGILLAVFMGGMCLGSLLLPRLVSARRHPFRVYGLLEIGIGALAILVWLEVPLIRGIYTGSGGDGPLSLIVRATIAGLCLLPPTVLMGATLPAIARWVKTTPHGVGWLGFLYSSNIGGAILGCLLAGFYLLRVHDTATATAVGVAINFAVGLVSVLLIGGRPLGEAAAGTAATPDPPAGVGSAATLVVIALSGLSALGAQVVWTRLLALLLGATVYTFSIILAVFLLGLGLGSSAGAAISRTSTHPRRDLGICQLLLAASIAWTAFMVSDSLPYWPIATGLSVSPWISFQLDIVRCVWAVLPATLFWGASFPLAMAAAAGRGQDPGRLVAAVYAANTLGAILGALFFSFVAVPAWGTQGAQQLLIVLGVVAASIVLAPAIWPPWRSPAFAAGGAAVVIAIVLALGLAASVPPVPGGLIAYGRSLAYRMGAFDRRTGQRVELPRFLYVGEGMNSSVAVSESPIARSFHVSGKVEASTDLKDMRLQRLLGGLPAFVHPNPRSVLIVGFGAGVTAGTFVSFPSIERIVICEIEPLIPQKVSGYFRTENHDVASDPRVKIIYDDARHYLLTTRETFDIITSDPIHPWVKGSAALYSLEYFQLMMQHLNPGGVVSQWLPLYQSSEPTVKGEVATFLSAFPGGSIWANLEGGSGYDLVLLGGKNRTVVDLDALDRRWKSPDHQAAVQSMQQVGFTSWTDMLVTYAGRDPDLSPWLAGARINRDRNLWLQYQAGLESLSGAEASIYHNLTQYRIFPKDMLAGSPELIETFRTSAASQ